MSESAGSQYLICNEKANRFHLGDMADVSILLLDWTSCNFHNECEKISDVFSPEHPDLFERQLQFGHQFARFLGQPVPCVWFSFSVAKKT